MNEEKAKVLEAAVAAMANFRKTFGRDLTLSFVAELYAARQLGLELCHAVNEPGFDAVDAQGKRYQIKYRSPRTLNMEVNNFDFDYLVLVNVDDNCVLSGMWLATTSQANEIFAQREKFRKSQVTQQKFKTTAKQIV